MAGAPPGVEEVAAACRALLSWQSTPEQRRAAEAFVTALRKADGKAPSAWGTLALAVGGEPPLEAPVRCLVAQTLRAQAQRARQPPGPEMVATVAQLLALEARRGARPVLTQLCLAAAAAAARAREWPEGEVLGRLVAQVEGLHPSVRLELVALLPAELGEKGVSMNPKRKAALQAALGAGAADVEGWLRAACAADGAGEAGGLSHRCAHAAAAFRCFVAWVTWELLPPPIIAASPLLQLAVAAVLDGESDEPTRQSATELVCSVCAVGAAREQLLPQLEALAATAQAAGAPPELRRGACQCVVALGVGLAPALLAWAPSAGGPESAALTVLTSAIGAISLSPEPMLSELSQDFWLAIVDAMVATDAPQQANAPLLEWLVGVCIGRSVLPAQFLAGPVEMDEEEEAEEARVGAGEVLQLLAAGPVAQATALLTRLEAELEGAIRQADGAGEAALRLEAVVFVLAMVGKPAITNRHGLGPEGAAVCVRLLQRVCALAAQCSGSLALAESAPQTLLYRSCIVLLGTYAGVAQLSPDTDVVDAAAAMEVVGASLTQPAAAMRAWGRGEDHVGAVAFWRLATHCARQLRPLLGQLAAGAMTAEVRVAMESRGWGGRRTDGRKLLVRGLCAVLWHATGAGDAAEQRGAASAVLGPLLAEVESAMASVPDAATAQPQAWELWCDGYCDSLGVLGAALGAQVKDASGVTTQTSALAVRLLWPQIAALVESAAALSIQLGALSAAFEGVAEATVETVAALPPCLADAEAEHLVVVCELSVRGFGTPSLPRADRWLRPLLAAARCCEASAAAQQALATTLPSLVGVFVAAQQPAAAVETAADGWTAMYELALRLATACPAAFCAEATVAPLLQAIVEDLLRPSDGGGVMATDRAAAIASLKLLARLGEWATPDALGGGEARAQLAATVQHWLATGGGTATAVGILRGASGSLPPWMIDNLAEALYGLGQVLGPSLPAVLDEAFASEVLLPPVRRDKPEPRAAAIKQLMEAKDRRVFKRVLKALCGGKKKGVAGAPPAT